MAKFSLAIPAALGAILIAGAAFAESVPVDTEKAVEEMTVIGPKPNFWKPQPMLEQQYFESLQLQFGPSSALVHERLAGQDPLDPRTWAYPSRFWDYQGSHVEEVALMQQVSGRSSGW